MADLPQMVTWVAKEKQLVRKNPEGRRFMCMSVAGIMKGRWFIDMSMAGKVKGR